MSFERDGDSATLAYAQESQVNIYETWCAFIHGDNMTGALKLLKTGNEGAVPSLVLAPGHWLSSSIISHLLRRQYAALAVFFSRSHRLYVPWRQIFWHVVD